MKQCDVTGYTVIDASIRQCPEPHVIKKFGKRGKCNVCWLICRKCKYGRKAELDGGIFCDYGK